MLITFRAVTAIKAFTEVLVLDYVGHLLCNSDCMSCHYSYEILEYVHFSQSTKVLEKRFHQVSNQLSLSILFKVIVLLRDEAPNWI